MVEALGLSELSKNDQDDVITRIGDLVFRESMSRTIETMSDDEAQAFSDFLESNREQQAVVGYLLEHAPQYVDISGAVAEEFMVESSAFMAALEK